MSRKPAVVLAGIAVAALVAGCSASVVSGQGAAASIPSSPTTPPPTTTGGFPAPSTSGGSSAPRPGAVESPDGDFSVLLPTGWTDATDRASSFGVLTVYLGPSSNGFASNVNVAKEDVGGLDVTQYRARALVILRQQLHVTALTDPVPGTVDGEPSLDYTFEDAQAGKSLKQEQTVVVHDGSGYVITYSALRDTFDASQPDASSIVESWQWG